MPRCGIAGSYGRSTFSSLKLLYTYSIVVASFEIPPTVNEGSLFPESPAAFVVSCFVDFAILTERRQNIEVVLVCISLVAKDDEHF